MTRSRTRRFRTAPAVLALLAAAACSADPVPPPPTPHSGATGPPTSTSTSTTTVNADAENKRLADRAAERAIAGVRLPHGTIRLAGRPHGLRRDGFSLGSAARTAWFSVPLDRYALRRYLQANPPRGMRPDGSSGESPETSSIEFVARRPPTPEKFFGPTMMVTWGDFEGRAVAEVQTYVQPRHVRPPESVVGTGVTSVEVSRTGVIRGFRPSVPVHLTVTSPRTIARLTRAVNRMYGSYLVPLMGSCPFRGDPPLTYGLTFHLGTDVLAFSWQPGCFGQVTVTRNGTALGETLEPGRGSEVVARVIAAARR
jgi:hypothetical protein